jgi:alanine racemase
MSYRPTRLEVNSSALEENYNRIRQIIGPERKFCAVVKANAYGMGAASVARQLANFGVDSFGIATLEEGVELRQAGVVKQIILLGALYGRDSLWEAILLDLEISIHHLAAFDDIASIPKEERKKLKFHLKVNTGMSRLGLQEEDLPEFCRLAKELDVNLKGVFTTFSTSDEIDSPATDLQFEVYQRIAAKIRQAGFKDVLFHAANSGAILNFPGMLADMVRPGMLLHGIPSYDGPVPEGFRPIARFLSEIVQINDFPAGTAFGYSGSHIVDRPTRAAVIPVGYADGFSRMMSDRGEVLIRGQRSPIIGRISMDMTILDISALPPDVGLGEKVTILGADGDDEITAWELAKKVDSIPWEIFCWIGPRVPRVYVSDEEVEAS